MSRDRESGAGRFKRRLSRNSDFRKFEKGTIYGCKPTPTAIGARRVGDRVALRSERLKSGWKSIRRKPSLRKGENINGLINEEFMEKRRFIKIRGD